MRNILNLTSVFFERAVKGFGLFFVSIILARYLSIEEFGALIYVQSVIQILAVLVSFGLNGVLQKSLLQSGVEKEANILSSAFWLQVCLGALSIFAGFLFLIFFTPRNPVEIYLLLILLITLPLKSFESIKLFNESKEDFSKNLRIEVVSYLVFLTILIFGVYTQLDSLLIALMLASELAILLMLYVLSLNNISYLSVKNVTKCQILHFLKKSSPLFLSAFFGILYMRVDVIFMREYLGVEEIARYMVSVRLVEIIFIVPTIMVPVLLPQLISNFDKQSDDFNKLISECYRFLFFIGITATVLFGFLGKYFVLNIFGIDYLVSNEIYWVLALTTVPVFWGFVNTYHLLVVGGGSIIFIRTAISLVFHIIFCILLIPNFGIMGAALAKLIGYFMGVFSLSLFPVGRQILMVTLRSVIKY